MVNRSFVVLCGVYRSFAVFQSLAVFSKTRLRPCSAYTRREKRFLIGKFEKPCFKSIDTKILPVVWAQNKKREQLSKFIKDGFKILIERRIDKTVKRYYSRKMLYAIPKSVNKANAKNLRFYQTIPRPCFNHEIMK